jgi:predicted DCC family thiol-disulfide oxidoreductase YuxK
MNTRSAALPITVFYDHSCPMCRSEMLAMKSRDHSNGMVLADCSAPEFDEAAYAKEGVKRADMMRLIHAKDAKGKWLIGVDVFVVVYALAGYRLMSAVWASRLLRPFLTRLYPWVADNRMWLSKFGVSKLFKVLEKPCNDGTCSIK